MDIVDVDAATRRGIQVTNAPNDWCADEVADHAIALWLAAVRKITHYDAATRRGEWQWQTGQPIYRMRGRVFGLLSFGAAYGALLSVETVHFARNLLPLMPALAILTGLTTAAGLDQLRRLAVPARRIVATGAGAVLVAALAVTAVSDTAVPRRLVENWQ